VGASEHLSFCVGARAPTEDTGDASPYKNMKKPFYITTPIYYVNDVPHIGHAYTTVAADILARYKRLQGYEVFFLTGTDEHGQKVQQAADKRGIPPQQHADELVVRFQDLWKRLLISNDDFIRTTEQRHRSVVQTVLKQLWDKDLIYIGMYQGWYCLPDERFWTEEELREGKCPECGRPVDRISEKNYFFKMSQFQKTLQQYIKNHKNFIRPESRRNEVLGFLEKPLGDLCISRPKVRLEWGIPLPFDSDYVTYVWVDALVNYISAMGYSTEPKRFKKWWPVDYHLVGKDILTTHAVYWSTFLRALDLDFPKCLFAHGWWTVDGEKMSKSKGNVVDPNAIIDELGPDAFRYFLLREVPFGQDGNFSREALIQRYNSDLANDLGNLVSRTLTMIEQFSDGIIPQAPFSRTADISNIIQGLRDSLEDVINRLEFHRALGEIWKLVDRINRYIEEMAPWNLAKKTRERERLETVLYTVAEALRFIAIYLSPFMPNTAKEIFHSLGLDPLPPDALSPQVRESALGGAPLAGKHIRKGSALFPRIEKKSGVALQSSTIESASTTSKKSCASIEDFRKLDLRVGKVLSAERITGSEKLLKLIVDLGTEQRQVVAGMAKKYPPETLIHKKVIVVANLKPTRLMGVESQGMILAAGDKEVAALATFLEDVEPGTTIR